MDNNRNSALTRRHLLTRSALLASGALLPRSARAWFTAPAPPVTVNTPLGPLTGTLESNLHIFRGIPFAQPPVGPLRFRPPVPVAPWTSPRDADRFPSAATQIEGTGLRGSEDCLYLNLWAPSTPGNYPVFVWIHGGGYTGGEAFSPIFDGATFASAGVICVTVAYRLGVFGFLDLSPILGATYAGSANNALRDLVEALRWVNTNIAAFGGDPKQVTVGGESAGAKATAALMAIPEARPLFHSMISESGGGERVNTLTESAAITQDFRSDLTAATTSATDPRSATPDALIAAQRSLLATSPRTFPLRPEVDGTYLTARPVDVVATGSARGKRLLIGTNRDESALFVGPHPAADPTQRNLGNLPLSAFNPVFARYAALYPEMTDAQRRIRALTAEEYWVPSVRLADAHTHAGGSAWMYRLDYSKPSGPMAGEAYHSLDLGFVWDHLDRTERTDPPATPLATEIHTAWIAFIKGQSPSAPGLPTWPEYKSSKRPTMLFDRTSRVEERPADAELRLWDGLL